MMSSYYSFEQELMVIKNMNLDFSEYMRVVIIIIVPIFPIATDRSTYVDLQKVGNVNPGSLIFTYSPMEDSTTLWQGIESSIFGG